MQRDLSTARRPHSGTFTHSPVVETADALAAAVLTVAPLELPFKTRTAANACADASLMTGGAGVVTGGEVVISLAIAVVGEPCPPA